MSPAMADGFNLLIDGIERAGSTGESEAVLDPATGDEIGRVAHVVTDDVRRQQRLAAALDSGVVGVNGALTHHPEAPLGGWKESGIDTEGGVEILEPYLRTKQVSIQ